VNNVRNENVIRSFLIDTDTASDDAVALIMALRSPDVRVEAITVVAGNVSLAQATRNALYTVELSGAETPVFAGESRPLQRTLERAEWFHGKDGLGDHGYLAARRVAEPEHAVDAIIRTVYAHPGLTLVTLGPLTNIAQALLREPAVSKNIERCVLMGGAPCCEGNVTPAAEYNIWVDPEAARIVLRSGMPIELIGWQLCRGPAVLGTADIETVLSIGTPLAQFAIECNSHAKEAYFVQTGEVGISLPDPICMAIALDPAICIESSKHYVEIETGSELTRGMTVVDRLNVAGNSRNRGVWGPLLAGRPNARVCWVIDVPRWKELLFKSLSVGLPSHPASPRNPIQ
jgi:purine nucleosidase